MRSEKRGHCFACTHTHIHTCDAVPSAYCSNPSTVKGGCGSNTSFSLVSMMRLKWYCLNRGADWSLLEGDDVLGAPEKEMSRKRRCFSWDTEQMSCVSEWLASS